MTTLWDAIEAELAAHAALPKSERKRRKETPPPPDQPSCEGWLDVEEEVIALLLVSKR